MVSSMENEGTFDKIIHILELNVENPPEANTLKTRLRWCTCDTCDERYMKGQTRWFHSLIWNEIVICSGCCNFEQNVLRRYQILARERQNSFCSVNVDIKRDRMAVLIP